MSTSPIIPISYKNTSGEAIPAFACVQLSGDSVQNGTTGARSVSVTKPSGTGPYAIDVGTGAGVSTDALYGQCVIPRSHTWWVKYNGSTAPATAWRTEVGPVSGQWYVDETGTGYLYAGAFDSTKGIILVAEKNGTQGCDCCPPCCGTLWYVVGDEIIWTADFYEGVPESQLNDWYSSSGPWPYVNACDADTAGNVYQCAFRSSKLETNLSRPQSPMYSLRSYGSAGNLQWSWAKYPTGFVSGSVRDTDYGTTLVRCGGANVFTQYAAIGDSDCHARRHSTTDGTPTWDINVTTLESGYGALEYMVGAGPTRILFTGTNEATTHYPVVCLDHDGAFAYGFQANAFKPVWIDDSDVVYSIPMAGNATPDGDHVASYDSDGTFLNAVIIRDGFVPTRLRTSGSQCCVSNGTEVRLYMIGGTGNYTHKITSAESLMVFSDRVGTKTEFITRLRSTTDLSAAYFFYPPTPLALGDDYLFTDAMPFDGGAVWCGRRVCGKMLDPEAETPTTTSTTTVSTTSTTSSTTTGSTTTGSTTTGSTTTGSTTTGSTTTGSTTTNCVTSGCNWIWTGTIWTFVSSTCNESCPGCVEPGFSGTTPGDTAQTNCQAAGPP